MRPHSKWAFISLILFLFFSATATANFNVALKLYEEQRFAEARVAFEALAAIGDRDSLYNLGVMYYRGEDVERDSVRGYTLMYFANKDYDSESMGSVVTRVYDSFSEEQRGDAAQLIEQLAPTYDIQAVRRNTLPVLLDDKDCVSELVALKPAAPKYPRNEQRNGKMGFSIVEITVSPQGYARDIYITRSSSSAFSNASAKAQKKFRYTPAADGEPSYGVVTRFTYVLGRPGKPSRLMTSVIRKEMDANLAAAEAGDVIAQYKYGRSLSELRVFEEQLKGLDLQYRDANSWFEKSAKGGLPHAQFEMGRNMIEGRGCEVDTEDGLKWVAAAAVGGHPGAQHFLAREIAAKKRTDQTNLAIISWLRNAALSDYYPAKVQLAWELSTTSSENLRDGKEALQLIEDEDDGYFDEVRLLETRAAARARLGDYKKAVRLQKKALDIAEDLEWSIPDMHDRLGLYQHEESWVGAYY